MRILDATIDLLATGGDSAGGYLALMAAITGDKSSPFDDATFVRLLLELEIEIKYQVIALDIKNYLLVKYKNNKLNFVFLRGYYPLVKNELIIV